MENLNFLYIKNYKRKQRRFYAEKYTIKRLRRQLQFYNGFRGYKNVNGVVKKVILPSDFLGSWIYFSSKTYSTDKWASKYKSKYSPNKTKMYYTSGVETRPYQKRLLIKELKENGIK
jgi:hypothetical protein